MTMLIDAHKLIHPNTRIFMLFTLTMALPISVLAAECGVVRLHTLNASEITITQNRCPTTTDLALESSIEIQAGKRVWLESAGKSDAVFQIICLNKSSTAQKIKVISIDSPWLSPLNLPDCSTWLDHRLVCRTGKQAVALLCAIAQKPPSVTPLSIQPRISATIRGFNEPAEPESPAVQPSLADIVKPDIDLCRKLTHTQHPVTLTWTIEPSGDVSHESITESAMDQDFKACVFEALKNRHFPPMPHAIQMTSPF